MPAPRITMRKIKDILRLKLDAKLSHEQIAAALDISKGVVTKLSLSGDYWPYSGNRAGMFSRTLAAFIRNYAARA